MSDSDEESFDFMYHRTLVRHERGTLWIMILLFAVLIAAMAAVLVWAWGHERQFATPSIYRGQAVEIQWGKHGK